MKTLVKNLFDDLKKVPFKKHLGIWLLSLSIFFSGYVIAKEFAVLGSGFAFSLITLSSSIAGVMLYLLYAKTFEEIEYQAFEIKRLQRLSSKEYWDTTMQCLLDSDLQIMAGDKDITDEYLTQRFEEERQKNADELARLTGKGGK